MEKIDIVNQEMKEHLIKRGMNPSLYRVSLDDAEGVCTFWLYNLSGQIVGFQAYRPGVRNKKISNKEYGRYFTYLKDKDGVFGLELLNNSDKNLYVVEGIFKAAVLHHLGYNAIAVLTSTPKRLKPWFFVIGQIWNLIAIGDADAAGQKLVNIVGKGRVSPRDLDEMTDTEIEEFLREVKNL